MKFWDDRLRICPKCKIKVDVNGEEKQPCPKCGTQVFFFNYRKLPPPPPVPVLPKSDFWGNPVSTVLLLVLATLSLLALLSFFHAWVPSLICALVASGFVIFAMIRHSEAVEAETKLKHYAKVLELEAALRSQTVELTERYNALLRTGNERIEHYFQKIYGAAEEELRRAERIRLEAKQDRLAVKDVEQRIYAMAERLVRDHLKWMTEKLRADPENYQRRKITLTKTFDFVESTGYQLPAEIRQNATADLKRAYLAKVREQSLRDEQKRINQQMREEARLLKQREKEIVEAEAREAEIAELLKEALASQAGIHSREVEELQRQLAEAHSQAERAKSLAQLTKVGHVYILSNVGSFGENVFKVGMTRREDPMHRVKELGDASVPFPFDVHAMVQCDDAPALENALHRELVRYRVNRVNLRKEYFQVPIERIIQAVDKHHGTVEYLAEPEALEYRESQSVSPDDVEELTEELAEMGVSLNEDDEFDLAID